MADGTTQETFCAPCVTGFDLKVTDTQVQYTFLGSQSDIGTGYFSPSSTSLNTGGLYIANGNLLSFGNRVITGVTLDGATTLPGFLGSNVTFNSGAIAVEWAGKTGIKTGDTVILDVNAVPEPDTYALMIVGAGLLGFAARRRSARLA